jgi:DNA-binding PadR family transcriptional regulator
MERDGPTRLERSLLLHLLEHRGQQVRFEADQWTTEFGIFRAFAHEDLPEIKNTLRALEMTRYIYRRVQYVIGYSEPKLVYSLTPSGHRKALDLRREDNGEEAPAVELEPTGPGVIAPRESGT